MKETDLDSFRASYFAKKQYKLPPLGDFDYGVKWPEHHGQKASPIVKELKGFANPGKFGFLSTYEHGLNLIRMLWPTDVKLFHQLTDFTTGKKTIIWNHFFLDVFKDLCENNTVGLTGCASSGKTFAVAVYCILRFLSDPKQTTILISTTAGSDAERRVWGDVKALHKSASAAMPIGTLIDYLKVITFDEGRELLGNKGVESRDIRNGIMLIPIPKGADGDNALGKVIGSKRKTGMMIWVIDELPNMIKGVHRPRSNLESNPRFQFIGIGNASKRSDEHGDMCEPVNGWSSVDQFTETWISTTGAHVRNCNGLLSPNFHPAIKRDEPNQQNQSQLKELLPYPWLCNHVYTEMLAKRLGRGNRQNGYNTIDYWRFAIGFWAGDDISRSILNSQLIISKAANRTDFEWESQPTVIAGFDPGWSANGDSNEVAIVMMGKIKGQAKDCLVFPKETIPIEVTVDDPGNRGDFRRRIALELLKELRKRNVSPSRLFMDINGDGGLMYAEIAKAFGSFDIVGLSSLEPTDNDERFASRVTQYWFQVADAVGTGRCFGFNTTSGYASDLFSREYDTVGRGRVKVEKKEEVKKRINRSPDRGDAICYAIEGARRLGFDLTAPEHEYEPELQLTEEQKEFISYMKRRSDHDDSEEEDTMFVSDHTSDIWS